MIIGSKIWKIFKQAAKISLKVTCIYPAYRWLLAVGLQRSEISGFLKSLEISIGNFTKLLKFPQSFKKCQRFKKKWTFMIFLDSYYIITYVQCSETLYFLLRSFEFLEIRMRFRDETSWNFISKFHGLREKVSFEVSVKVNPRGGWTTFFQINRVEHKNSTKRRLTAPFGWVFVFNSAFGRHRHWL